MDESAMETESNCSMEDAMAIVESVLRRNMKKTDNTDCQLDEIDALG